MYRAAARFFGVALSPQAYLNVLYLAVAFPLGLLYFVVLISGLATGLSLAIVWIGIPILALMGVVAWVLASGERLMVIHWLKEDVPAMARPLPASAGLWERLRQHISNPVTWKSVAYLLMKLPLGLAAFVVLATLVPLVVALVSMPFLYHFTPSLEAGVLLGSGAPGWRIDSLGEAALVALGGLMLWPITLHVTNGMTWVHAKFARLMLSRHPGLP
jgi:hypothetical protein